MSLQVCIVGGGLVGSLAASYLARRGHLVDVYDLRNDPRDDTTQRGRSINLALSKRGCDALERVGLLDSVLDQALPMRARYIHKQDETHIKIPYGTLSHHYINSVDRNLLNCILLSAAESHDKVTLYFNHKLTYANAKTGQLQFETSDGPIEKQYDLIFACDGAFSKVRESVTKKERFNFDQYYLDHSYLEIPFPALENGNHAMPINYLHIWPRDDFMLIGLPNKDGTFTGTMFMPTQLFNGITNETELVNFFKKYFPDALKIIGEKRLLEDYFLTKPQPLLSVKCSPYDFHSRVLLLGDAAHAMAPFYGQGMNCGLEDLIILDDLLDKHGSEFSVILPEFTRLRKPDAHTIVDLSMINYVEMRHSVNNLSFRVRKLVDNTLYKLLGNIWCPLYTMVSFSRTPYSLALARRRQQDYIISKLWSWLQQGALFGVLIFMTHRHGVLSKYFSILTQALNLRKLLLS